MTIVPSDQPAAGNGNEMTRLLCAGARLDAGFARKVIATLLDDRERFAAPAYGYDAVPVLAHALDARRARWARLGITTVCVCLVLVFVLVGLLGVLAALLLCLWAAWTSIIVEQVLSLHVLVKYLKSPDTGGDGFDGGYPQADSLSRLVAEEITAEQDTTHGVVYYGGYRPFVGAGKQLRRWSFPVLLEPVDEGIFTGGARRGGDRRTVEWFTVEEVTDYLQKQLPAVLRADAVDDQRIERLDVGRRWYQKAVWANRPQLRNGVPDVPRRTSGPQLYDLAREYLCVRVGSWDDELVTSVFVSLDVKGNVLYTELYSYVLPPIRRAFRSVDQLPDSVDSTIVGRVAWQAMKSVLGGLFTIPFWLFGLLAVAAELFSSRAPREPEDLTRYAKAMNDHGALVSVRELAAISGYHHFFQEVDAEKYTTIVERRVLDLLADFLADKGLDTGEFRERQTTVLNYGIIHRGTGDVVNTGTQAMGPQSKATTKPALAKRSR